MIVEVTFCTNGFIMIGNDGYPLSFKFFVAIMGVP